MTNWLPRLGLVAVAAVLLTAAYKQTSSANVMAESANRFLASLTPEQKAKAVFTFEDAERVNWAFVPLERKGLTLREMTPFQKHLASALLSAGLSQAGFIKAVKIEGRRAYPMLVLILLTLVVVLLNHEVMLFGAGIAYLISGPVLWWLERKNPKAAPETPGEPQQEHVGDVR
jgi:hypothetical protein